MGTTRDNERTIRSDGHATLPSVVSPSVSNDPAPAVNRQASVDPPPRRAGVGADKIGATFGHFRIEARLGAGGMGEVFRAWDLRLDRLVALKLVLSADCVSAPDRELAVARLEREARAAAAIHHPNVVAIHEIGDEGGLSFIAMEYVEGTTLRRRLSAGPLPIAEACRVLLDIASALEAAHDRGIVHRDVKPENVIVGSNGGVKVLDFGIARRVEANVRRDELTGTAP